MGDTGPDDTEAVFEDPAAINADGPMFPSSTDTVHNSLFVPVNKQLTSSPEINV